MRFRLITIDLDGTLVDTADEIAEAANRTLEDFGIQRRPAGEIAKLIGAGTRVLMRKLVAQVFEAEPALDPAALEMTSVMARFDIHYAATAGTTGQPYRGCTEALQRLRGAGVRLVCLTNKETHYARQVLHATRLDGYFELLIGGDTLPVHKPDPAVMAHVLHTLGESAETTAHVGDSRTDVETARNAGVPAWVVPYGYNAGEPIEAASPHRIFADLSEMAAYVLAANACSREDLLPLAPNPVRLGQ